MIDELGTDPVRCQACLQTDGPYFCLDESFLLCLDCLLSDPLDPEARYQQRLIIGANLWGILLHIAQQLRSFDPAATALAGTRLQKLVAWLREDTTVSHRR